MKQCTKCGEIKPLNEISPDKRRAGGLSSLCRACHMAMRKAWKLANPEKVKEHHRTYSKAHPDKVAQKSRVLRATQPERVREYGRKSRAKAMLESPEKIRGYARAHRIRAMRDPAKRLRAVISQKVSRTLAGKKNWRTTASLVGYSAEELRAHLERQFVRGMSWDNYGKWHIDHIIPLAAFSITGPDDPELRRAWALPNLRPLWAADNMRKGARIESLL